MELKGRALFISRHEWMPGEAKIEMPRWSTDRFNAFTLTIALSKVTSSEQAGLAPMRAPKHHAASHTKTAGSSRGDVTQLFLAGKCGEKSVGGGLTFTSLCFLPKAIPASRLGWRDGRLGVNNRVNELVEFSGKWVTT